MSIDIIKDKILIFNILLPTSPMSLDNKSDFAFWGCKGKLSLICPGQIRFHMLS